MTKRVNPAILVGGALLLLALSAFIIFRTVSTPRETITRFEDVPAKGAGKFDRQ
jgi:hypothetical protein